MQKVWLLMFLFSLVTCSLRAQDPAKKETNTQYLSPYDHLVLLQEGALLVRLKTSQNKIDALTKAGKTGWASKVAREQKAENQRIVNAFKKYYTFSPVYFFYSEDSEKILARQFDEIVLNADLQPAFRNGYFPASFLVAEIGPLADTRRRYSESGQLITESDGSQSTNIEGLVISDDNLIQLSDPFPYFVRSFKSLGADLRRSEDRMVEKLNENLIRFSKIPSRELKAKRYYWQRN